MKTVVIDPSVAAAWYLTEQFSDAARQWQQQLLDGTIRAVVPTLHFYEFGNVLRTLVQRRQVDGELAREIFDTHLAAPLETIDPDRARLLERALEYESTVYDAVYISLALELDAILLTAERTTTPWVVRLGANVEVIE